MACVTHIVSTDSISSINKSKGKDTQKQAATEGNCSSVLATHLILVMIDHAQFLKKSKSSTDN